MRWISKRSGKNINDLSIRLDTGAEVEDGIRMTLGFLN